MLKKAAENTEKKKDEKKMNLELFKMYPDYGNVHYGVWVNPTQKAQFRPWPINFVDLGIQCEVPKPLMAQPLLMKICHTLYDQFPQENKLMVVVSLLSRAASWTSNCLNFYPNPKKPINFLSNMCTILKTRSGR